MTSLILRAPAALTAPLPNTPRLPDIETGLFMRLRASDLALADGATVAVWTASGSAPLADRLFDESGSAGASWALPTFAAAGGPGGRPAVTFNGNQRTTNTTAGAATGLSTLAQPTSYAVVFRGTGGSTARVTSGGASTLQNIVPKVGSSNPTISAGTTVPVEVDTANWTILIVAFDGANSKVKANGGAIQTVSAGTQGYNQMSIGGSGSNTAGNVGLGLNGALAEMRMYSRKLTDDDIEGLYQQLRADYGL